MASVFISIGSNMKDRLLFCRKGISELSHIPNTSIKMISSFYETEPHGVSEKMNMFINAVIELNTEVSPQELLNKLQEIENKLGRIREKNKITSRTLDLDLLLYDDQIIDTNELTVPHPRMHLRRFVLEPLAEIAPNTFHPSIQMRISEILEELIDKHTVKRLEH